MHTDNLKTKCKIKYEVYKLLINEGNDYLLRYNECSSSLLLIS